MAQCKGWTYPIDRVAIDGSRVVYNRESALKVLKEYGAALRTRP